MLDHDIDATAVGQRTHRIGHVVADVVDGRLGAERDGARQLGVARRRDDRPRAGGPADLERRARDAAADTPDQHPLARTQRRLRHEHAPGRHECEPERARLVEAPAVRDGVEVARGDEDVVGVRAVDVLAEDLEAEAHRVLTRQAEAAAAAEQAGIDQDRLPDLDPLRVRPELRDDARAVGAERPRLRHRRKPAPEPHVEVVERGGAEPYDGGAALRLGRLDVLEAQDLGAAVLMDSYRSHRGRMLVQWP